MNKIIYIFCFFLTLLSANAKKVPEFKFTPNNIFLNGIESKDSIVIAFGDLGTFYFSTDNGNKWHRKQVMEFGKFKKCIFVNDTILLFNENGSVVVINDLTKEYNVIDLKKDKIISVVNSEDGYCIRSLNYLTLYNRKFELIKQIELNSNEYLNFVNEMSATRYLPNIQNYKIQSYEINSFVIFNGLYYLYSDSINITRFDANLTFIDRFKVRENQCDTCDYWNQLHVNNDLLYLNLNNKFVRSKNYNNFEEYYSGNQIMSLKPINGKIILITAKDYNKKFFELTNINEISELCNYKFPDNRGYELYQEISDYTISGNNLIFIYGYGKQIYKLDLNNKEEQLADIISENRAIIGNNKLLHFNDSIINIIPISSFSKADTNNNVNFTETFNSQKAFNIILESKDNLDNLKPKLKKEMFSKNNYFKNVLLQNIDKVNKRTYQIINAPDDKLSLYTSIDTFKTLKFYTLDINIKPSEYYFSNLEVDTNFCFAINYLKNQQQINEQSIIYLFNTNYQKINEIKRENKYIDYIYSKSKDEYIFYEFDYADSIKHVLHTLDNFKTVDTLFSFTKEDKIIYKDYYEFNHHDTDYVAFFNYKHIYYSQISQRIIGEMYILNTQTNEFNLRFTFPDSLNIFYDFEERNHALADYDNDTLYLSAYGNIYTYYLDRPNRAVFNYAKLPDNGRFRFNFQKIGNRFYGLYSDSLRTHNNYWLDISFKEVEDPKPIIQANDFDFGKFDIKETEYKKTKVKVENLSNEADLMIFTYGISDTVNFKTNINDVVTSQPFVIFKGQSVEFEVEFTPKEIGIKECKFQFLSNALTQDEFSILKGEAIDTIKTSVEDIEEISYIYTMPPYPNPTVSEVTAKFYWDSRIDIDNSEIGVFDITGNKVSGKENLILEKLNQWSGNIKWNCVGQPKGTYLIKIQHGNNTKTVKVVVN
ncbi:MAG: T9SS type A sorting domain-containing protein [Candidatus Kapaibacteriota bacterium]